jgi:CO/xanthine dehydrogenase FAD-binding subunit
MKPADFDYVRPASLSEAAEVLAACPEGAKILAGGQSLVPLMNLRMVTPRLIVDINGIRELDYVAGRDGGVAIGAIARQAFVEASSLVTAGCPLIVEALSFVGHPQVRNRGTVVGSLAHHDPAAELPAVAVALGAQFTLRTAGARSRTMDADDFFQGRFATAADPAEIVTEVWFPAQRPGTGWSFVEVARRHGSVAIVGVAASVEVSAGLVARAALALGGVADRPVRCSVAESYLLGRPPDGATIAAAGALAAEEEMLSPANDLQATAQYRRAVVPVLVEQALQEAARKSAAGRGRRSPSG